MAPFVLLMRCIMGGLLIIAHRGQGPTSRKYRDQFLPPDIIPENSMRAFSKALDDGAEGLELDVFITKDQRAVVVHDNEIDRNVSGYYNCWNRDEIPSLGLVADKTLAEVQQFDIGNGYHMPSLEDVIGLVASYILDTGKQIKLNIEIKGDDAIVEEVHRLLVVAVEREVLSWDNFVINSFDPRALAHMRRIHPDHELRLFQGFNTKTVFGGNDELDDSWVPVVRTSDGAIRMDGNTPLIKERIEFDYFKEMVVAAKEAGCNAIDIVSSDLNDDIMTICMEQGMDLAVAMNAVRARAQEEILNRISSTNPAKTDIQIEEQEIKKMHGLAQRYPEVRIYFKADNPGRAIAYRSELEAAEAQAQAYTSRAAKGMKFFKEAPSAQTSSDERKSSSNSPN